jgi:hypothetical protein
VLLVELKALRETAAKIAPANAVFTVPETLKVRAFNVVMEGSHFFAKSVA